MKRMRVWKSIRISIVALFLVLLSAFQTWADPVEEGIVEAEIQDGEREETETEEISGEILQDGAAEEKSEENVEERTAKEAAPEEIRTEESEKISEEIVTENETGKKELPEKCTFFLEERTSGYSLQSFQNSSQLPISNVRFDRFARKDGKQGTADAPNLAIGIKYVEGDDKNTDGGGKWRYVYCLDIRKDSPQNALHMRYVGWANRKVSYALYYGALYYKQLCRYSPYSTGNWQLDYFVTQTAVHVLNGEVTLEAVKNGLNLSSASAEEKQLVYDRIGKMVNGANKSSNYGGFTSDGWLDLQQGSFSLDGYQDSWSEEDGTYLSAGVFHGTFTSYYGYDFKEQLTRYSIKVPDGVQVKRTGKQTYADFRVGIRKEQYENWERTGMRIPVEVEAALPRFWGAGIYQSTASNYQRICLLTWESKEDMAVFRQRAELTIPKKEEVRRNLTICKQIRKDELLWEHGDPTFFFRVWGKDLEGKSHSWQRMLVFRPEDETEEELLTKEITFAELPPGKYQVEELDLGLRYILTDVWAKQGNISITKEHAGIINGVEKIRAGITADLSLEDGGVAFADRKVMHDVFSDNAAIVNHFGKTTE